MARIKGDIEADVVVIGTGFGGLGAALTLAERGADVVVFEALNYPGGCASTFERRAHRFESGATLFSGFGEGELMNRWIERHQLDLRFEPLDPVVELRWPGHVLHVPRDREQFINQLVALAPSHARGIRSFFRAQERIAAALWQLFDRPELLPPFPVTTLPSHVMRLPGYLRVLPWIGRSVLDLARRHGVADVQPLRVFLDGVCQITVQCEAEDAEAPFALSAMDYYFRGTGHVDGGIGVLARELVRAIRNLGGAVHFSDRVKSARRTGDGWIVESRRTRVTAPVVVGNLLPRAASTILGTPLDELPRAKRWAARVEDGWGATMLYLVLRPDPELPQHPHHFELIADPDKTFEEGRHIFVSLSGADERRGPDGARTATVSTHVPMRRLRELSGQAKGAYVEAVQNRMRATLADLAPEVAAAIVDEMTASPRTFERFTRRPEGFVGGVPRRVGLHNYRDMVPAPIAPNFYLVGDTVFPGQSTLATAIGGLKVAERVARRLSLGSRTPQLESAPAPAE